MIYMLKVGRQQFFYKNSKLRGVMLMGKYDGLMVKKLILVMNFVSFSNE